MAKMMTKNWFFNAKTIKRLPKQVFAGILSVSLIMQPLFASAQQISVDPNAGASQRPNIGAAPNGVPMIDIATPNGAGLSHNKYNNFNIGTPGLILNNHNGEIGTSQLGGVTPSNPNLRSSGSATVILNEVTSGNRSALEGPAEVFGRQADVIIANPNGITCNGCGFINTPRATLTTGIPQIGLDGRLTGFDVKGGDVTFGEKGANLSSGKGSVDIFDIVSRTVIINGPVSGHDIGINAGTGKFDYASREFKELTDITGKPQYAIDGSALGALQADRIKIVATEKGVGVRMRADMAANAGEVSLSANGKVSLNNVSGRDGVTIKANDSTIEARKVTSKKSVNIKADQGITLETIGADGDLMVDAGRGLLSAEGDLIAGGNVSLSADGSIKANQVASGNQMLVNAGQDIDVLVAVANGHANLISNNGSLRSTNGIKAGGDLNITANKGSIEAATLISFNNMTLSAGQDLNITGNVRASQNVNVNTGRNLNAGFLLAGQDINLRSLGNMVVSTIANGLDIETTEQSGNLTFARQANMVLNAPSGTITLGNIYSTNTINISTTQALSVNNTLAASSHVVIDAGSISGQRLIAGMQLIGQNSNGALNGSATTTLTASSGDIVLQQILSGGALTLNANQGSIVSNQIQSGADVNAVAQNGSITAQQIYADGRVNLTSGHTISVVGGSYSGSDFNIITQSATLGDATIKGNLNVNSNTFKANSLSVYGVAQLNAQDINLQTLFAGQNIIAHTNNFTALRLISGLDIDKANETGLVSFNATGGKTLIDATDAITLGQAFSADDMQLNAKNNIQYQYLFSDKNVALTTELGTISLENSLIAGGNINLTAKTLDLSNNRAKVQTAQTLNLNAQTIDVSNSALVYGGLSITAASTFNAQNAKLSAIKSGGGTGDIQLNIPTLTVDRYTNILADNNLIITTSSLENFGQLASGNDLQLNATGTIINRSTGLIYAAGNGAILADGDIVNDFGAILTQGDLKFANLTGTGKNSLLKNTAGLIQAGQNLSILTNHLINEANGEPEINSSSQSGGSYSFLQTDKVIMMILASEGGMKGYLYYDPKKGGWGPGNCDNTCDEFKWLQSVFWDTKEGANGVVTLPDGTTYKAFTWNLAGSQSNGQQWYSWNSLASMLEQTQTQYFVKKPSTQGMIQAGGDMVIDATTIDNLYSNIEAGGDATITSDTVNNKGVTLYQETFMTCFVTETCYAYNADGSRNAAGDIAALSSKSTGKVAVDSLSSLIKAGGALNIEGVKNLNNTAAEGSISGSANYKAEGSSGNPLDALNGLTAGGALFDKNIDLNLVQKDNGNFSLSTAIERGDISAPRPNSGGFGGTLPNQYFVYETRAAYLDVGKFYGSGYFMNRVGYKPDHQILFLGDAYFENQLIDKQMRDLVGEGLGKGSFVVGNDPIEQMKSLLDAGADYSAQHGLTFGEPLTAEQVASLDKSIVIYVKQTVNGMEVYAPVLYVAAKDKASVSASGSKIQGGSVNITVDNLKTSGLISSNSDLKIQGADILSNGGGFAAKGNVILASTGNLELNAGTTSFNGQNVTVATQAINAGGTALLSADNNLSLNGVNAKAGESIGLSGNNVTIGTANATTLNGSQNVTGSNLEAGKDIQVKADNDITVTGSSVSAGDRLAMSAENGNLTIQSAEANRTTGSGLTTTQQKSDISSGGSMSLSANKNVVIAGSDAKSGGNLVIDAGENVAVVATQDRSVEIDGKRVATSTTQQGSNISADQSIGVQAGEDILIGASNLDAKGNVGLQAQGDITVTSMENQSGEHVSSKKVQMNREETTQVGSSITAGGNVTAIAGLDGEEHNLNIVGSTIDADGKVGLKATGDVNILASEDSYHEDLKTKSTSGGLFKKTKKTESSKDATIKVSSSISGEDGINIQSGNNTTIAGSNIIAGTEDKKADINIKAGSNIIISSETSSLSMNDSKNSKGFLSSDKKKTTSYDEYTISSNLAASNNINLNAGEHIAIAGSNLHAVNDMNIEGSSVSIIGAQEDHNSSSSKKKSGFGVGSGDGFYSVWGKEGKTQTSESTENVSSNVSAGHNVNITARDTDVNIVGSNVIAQNDINLDAARDINILPGKESYSESETKSKSGIGVQLSHSDTGASIGLGYNSTKDSKSGSASTNATSGLRAGNDVNMKAGNDVNIQASDINALRDVNIHAENDVNLLSADDVTNYKEMHEKLFAGITLSVESGTLQGIQSINNAVDNFNKAGTDKNGLLNVAAGIYNSQVGIGRITGTITDIKALASGTGIKDFSAGQSNSDNGPSILDKGNLISGSLTVGFNKSKSETNVTTSSPVVTTIEGGRSVNITAQNGDINGIGVQIEAGTESIWNIIKDEKAGDINLTAGKNINLESAVATENKTGKTSSMGINVGVDISGRPLANAEYSKGNAKGQSSTHINSHIVGSGDVTLKSGADTNLKGAVVSGNSVTADIGGNLNIESMQDTATSKSKNTSITASIGSQGVSGGYQYNKTNSDYASVGEQSGIVAGNGGFNIKVDGNTDLKGGIISSSADSEKNNLITGTLTTSDIINHSDASAESGGFILPNGAFTQGKYGVIKTVIGNALNNGEAEDSNKGITQSAISNGNITITNNGKQLSLTGKTADQTIAMLNRDPSNAHTPAEQIDVDKLAKQAAEEQALLQNLFKLGVQYTDDAYDTLFKTEQPMDVILTDSNGKTLVDSQGNPLYRRLTSEEQSALQGGKGEVVRVFFNGINTDEKSAIIYAVRFVNDENAGPIYVKWMPPANTTIGELLVAGYQKTLESSFWGLTDSAQTVIKLKEQFGDDGLQLYGHSRGSMTIYNAMKAMGKSDTDILTDTKISIFGPAANAQKTADLLSQLSGGKSNKVWLENHANDPVATIVGGNPATMTTIPNGSLGILESLKVFIGGINVHGCYGAGSDKCTNNFGPSKGIYIQGRPNR